MTTAELLTSFGGTAKVTKIPVMAMLAMSVMVSLLQRCQ